MKWCGESYVAYFVPFEFFSNLCFKKGLLIVYLIIFTAGES